MVLLIMNRLEYPKAREDEMQSSYGISECLFLIMRG